MDNSTVNRIKKDLESFRGIRSQLGMAERKGDGKLTKFRGFVGGIVANIQDAVKGLGML